MLVKKALIRFRNVSGSLHERDTVPDSTIIWSKKQHVTRITLKRPGVGNAINRQMAGEIGRDDDVYVVVITGAGEGAFCAGSEPDAAAYGVYAALAEGESQTQDGTLRSNILSIRSEGKRVFGFVHSWYLSEQPESLVKLGREIEKRITAFDK